MHWPAAWENKDVTASYLLKNLPERISEDDIRAYFGVFAQIKEVTLKQCRTIIGTVKFVAPTAKLRDQMLKGTHEILGAPILVQTYKMHKQKQPGYAAKWEAESAEYVAQKQAKAARLPADDSGSWVCDCGFKNSPKNVQCGGTYGDLGCKKARAKQEAARTFVCLENYSPRAAAGGGEAGLVDRVVPEAAAAAAEAMRSAVEELIRTAWLDQAAADALRSQSPQIQKAVMERDKHRPLAKCDVPSAMLMSRIAVEEFLQTTWLDQTAADALRFQSPQIQKAVMERDKHMPLAKCDVPSAILMSRIAVELFLQTAWLDQTAADALRSQSPQIQKAVIERDKQSQTTLAKCEKPSATLMSWIKKAQEEQQQKAAVVAAAEHQAAAERQDATKRQAAPFASFLSEEQRQKAAAAAAAGRQAAAGLVDRVVPEVVAGIGDTPSAEQTLRGVLAEASVTISDTIIKKRSLMEGVEKYAEKFVNRLFDRLGDSNWLWAAGQFRFIVALVDAGIKDSFPADLLWTTEQEVFECAVLRTCAQCVDERRIEYALLAACKALGYTKQKSSTRNAVRAAVYAEWKRGLVKAAELGTTDTEEFVSGWVSRSVAAGLRDIMKEQQVTRLFRELQDNCGLPVAIAPGPIDGLEEIVRIAYTEGKPPQKRQKLEGPPGR